MAPDECIHSNILGGLVAGLIMNGKRSLCFTRRFLGDETGLLYEKFGIGIPGTAG